MKKFIKEDFKFTITYLSKKQNFAKVEKGFNTYLEALKWGRQNLLANFNPDMINIKPFQVVQFTSYNDYEPTGELKYFETLNEAEKYAKENYKRYEIHKFY